MLLAAAQIRAVSLLLLFTPSCFQRTFSPLTSGVCRQLADTRAAGQPVFGLNVRREHTQHAEVT